MEKSNNKLKIKVISIGGAGTNMINRIIETTDNKDIDYISISTNREELNQTKASSKLLIGEKITKGLGTFGNVYKGVKSVEESKKEITKFLEKELKDTNVVFLVLGLGGGTGTGVAPLISNMIRKMGIVIIGVVTTPFSFEKKKREISKKGKEILSKNVNTLILIPCDNMYLKKVTSIIQTLKDADDSVRQSVQGICNIFLSSKIEDLSYQDLMNFLQEEII